MDLQTLRSEAVIKRFPFLDDHVSSRAVLWAQSLKADLAHEEPKRYSGGSDDYGWVESRRDILLLNEKGEKIGTVGEVPKFLPAWKFCGITLRREKWGIRKIRETLQDALNRVEGVFYVLIVNTHSAYGDEATLYLSPNGQTAKAYLGQLLAEARSKEELRLRTLKEGQAAVSREEQRKKQEALDTETARIDNLLREINGK